MERDTVAGYVLAGGRSRRMGRDKALIEWGDRTLLQHVASIVRDAVGTSIVIGRDVGGDVGGICGGIPDLMPDLMPDRGPLGGLWTALSHTSAEWVLIVACDMPNLTVDLLRGLASATHTSTSTADADADAIVCETERGLHPLCAVYHRRLRAAAEAAVRKDSLRMHDFLSSIHTQRWPVADPSVIANINTPQELEAWKTR